jgi:hypothetical protein
MNVFSHSIWTAAPPMLVAALTICTLVYANDEPPLPTGLGEELETGKFI